MLGHRFLYRCLMGVAFALVTLPVSAAESRQVKYLNFTVQNRHGVYVRDLKLEEVSLRLDKEPKEIGYLGYRDVETAFAFILENSPRTAQYPVSQPQWGQINKIDEVRYFLQLDVFNQLVELGPVLLAEFYEDLTILENFTAEDYKLSNSIGDMRPNFSGIKFDLAQVGRALGRGVDLLRNRPEKRKYLILYTASVDRDSYQNLEEYKGMFRGADVEVFIVADAPRFSTGSAAFSFEEKMSGFFFRNLAKETAGKAYLTTEYVYLEELFTDLISRLTNSYTIGFYVEPGRRPEDHKVEIEVGRDKCDVTHRDEVSY